MSMFCYQCEQASKGTGCSTIGVCGKEPETAALQDLLIRVCKEVSAYAHRARGLSVVDKEIDLFVAEALFTTVTNVNFDPLRIEKILSDASGVRDRAQRLYEEACSVNEVAPESIDINSWAPAGNLDGLILQGRGVGLQDRIAQSGEDITGLQELLLYGVKGTAAYAVHALRLGYSSDDIFAFFHEVLSYLGTEEPTVEKLLELNLRCGEVNLAVMELLDSAHTTLYGHPVPTKVRMTPVKGKAILVSGHDLKDLKHLLEQTEGKGINIYTHGEMLPAHGYPELNKYSHLVGNYGGAWQDQREEFEAFPGSILMTTNCIQLPKDSYKARIFTTGLVAWPGVEHLSDGDFGALIDAALAAPGFAEDEEEATSMVGFGHNAVLGVADKVIDGVKSGAIKHFFLIGGCDGAKTGRNYYTDLAQSVPDDCVIMTLACGKFRFNRYEFGDIGGIPRLLDIGQCNDAYSAIRIASALAEAFNCGVNDLPLSLILSWYEQKAVAILLTLLHLGVRNIRLGPTLPAFLSPAVIGVLSEKFGLQGIGDAKTDLEKCLGVH